MSGWCELANTRRRRPAALHTDKNMQEEAGPPRRPYFLFYPGGTVESGKALKIFLRVHDYAEAGVGILIIGGDPGFVANLQVFGCFL